MSSTPQHTTMETVEPTRAEEVAHGLRQLADWLEARPDMPVQFVIAQVANLWEKRERERFLELARRFDEPTPERTGHGEYRLTRKFTGGVEITLQCDEKVLAPERPAPSPWPVEIRALAPDADWGDS